MRIRFVLAEIFHGFRRNLTMISAVILVTFVSLSAVGAALMLQLQVDRLKGAWYDKVEVQVWLCPAEVQDEGNCAAGAVTADQQQAVEDRLNSSELAPYVDEVTVETKEEVYQSFQDRFSGSYLAEEVTQDSLGPVLHVKMSDPTNFEVVTDAVGTMPGVLETYDQSDLFEPLFDVLAKVRLAALAIALVLALAAILLITTTIRLSALSRQRETSIMKLVGASNIFIQLPFMLEGAVAALLGSALAVGALWGVTRFWLADWVQANFDLLMGQINPMDVFKVAPWLVLAAVVLAGFSSALTLRRFTKV
ncbi:MAG: permease-like cell division protein FtsX [Bifidobacteriaceae bacterium]|jgi:cell division transport system permease protein|nr:permease-like cell division protein FtsX [Bifidobacteriaceae bacterium]